MGSKNDPGEFDCYDVAEPDEPLFVLLARDVSSPLLIELWADLRALWDGESEQVIEARHCAAQMRRWREVNRPPAPAPPHTTDADGFGWHSNLG